MPASHAAYAEDRTALPPGHPAAAEGLAADIRAALVAEPEALREFLRQPPSHRREHLKHIDEAARPETRRRRIQTTIERLRDADQKRDHGQA